MDKICFFSIDVEPDLSGETFQGVKRLDSVLEFLKDQNIPATLFVSGLVLERHSDKLKEWASGFEIASHSFTHQFWPTLSFQERENELQKFIELYWQVFKRHPLGFRAPSHLIDNEGLRLVEENGFLYDSSVLPHYPFFKKYRGFQGKAPLLPYKPSPENPREKGSMRILEIPVAGHLLGIPLVGKWLKGLPFFVYRILFLLKRPAFLTVTLHSFDALEPKIFSCFQKLVRLLKKKNYQFLSGKQIYAQFQTDRR